ncbi:MAG: nucleotidyl transferase AbiEii/AbiGii toxin family protein [Acidobacteriaceae bacterium]
MVKGLEIFREHFRNYADRYVLIGGAACDIAMTAAGLAFRATKDLDIVLYVEALDAAFVKAFWEFVLTGGYEVQEKSTGEKQFYRFQKPTNADYPFMLELFSRQPDVLQVAEGSHLTPLPIEEDTSSLSAILLDNDYYEFIRAGRQEVDGVPMVGAAQLIALKARAWLDLTERDKRGEKIDSKTIKKHKNDVFRLYQILDPASDPVAPDAVKNDIREFISRMSGEDVDLKSLGLRTGTRDDILAAIANVYRLAEAE